MSEQTTYRWLELGPVAIPGQTGEVLNRRIATHLKFRADVEAGKDVSNRIRPTVNGYVEALRRELFIRRDILRAMEFKQMDTAGAKAALEAVKIALRDAL